MYRVIDVGGITLLKWMLLVLFLVNFSWIALAFTSAVVGFLGLLFTRPRRPACADGPEARTAVVMPIYNEATARIFAALQAIREDGRGDRARRAFRLFHPLRHHRSRCLDRRGARLPRAARALGAGRADLLSPPPEEHRRKAGNIADFVAALGRRLRAHGRARRRQPDDGRLHRARSPAAMEADPDAGIIQIAAADHQPQHPLRARCSNSRRASTGR